MTFPCVRPDSPRDGGAGYLDDRQAALLSVAVGPEDRLTFAHADQAGADRGHDRDTAGRDIRSEEHTSELQSLMRISYAVFCLKKKTTASTSINKQHIQHISTDTSQNVRQLHKT